MSNPAISYLPAETEIAPVKRPMPEGMRATGRKLRLSGVTSGDPMGELLAALPDALGRRMRFFEPTAEEQSFDELWLANALDAVRAGDEPRYRFAMLSRMSKARAASLHFLMCRAAYSLDIV
ncbi:hypothetical protein [Yoonia litorea]|uniref:Uncharacterized protein n=1 Tax=Yoonia litorea TaxID=1123755 RepID=A0A1I6LS79_9RHOB|nr:hypothetical protein [Yoonia litorea]SFS06284.1 hypothetical protein SAMN05444714_0843 [Yoonia litorea]